MSTLFDIHMASDLSEWSGTVTDSGDLSWAAAAGLGGTSGGLSCLIDDANAIYAEKDLGSNNTSGRFRWRFYLDPNSLTMANNNNFYINQLINGGGSDIAYVRLYYAGGSHQIRTTIVNDTPADVNGTARNITDAPHYIELELKRATNSTSSDGSLQLWIDGVDTETITGVDNYDRFPSFRKIRIGAISGIDAGTSGTFYLDELKANDDGGVIGPSSTSTPMTLEGANTPSGALVMEFDTTKAGAATPSGAVTKQIQTAKAGAVTPAGALTNQIQTTFAGGDTPSGSLVSQFATPKAGAATPSGALVMQLQRVLAGAIAPLGDLVKEIQAAFAGGATPSGVLSYIKARVDTFAGGATPAGALSRVLNFARTHGGEIVPSGEFTYVANVAPVVSADGGGVYGTIAQRRQLVRPTETKEDDLELALLVAGWKILKGRVQ